MSEYRLYRIAHDHFTGVDIFDAGDDGAALDQARERVTGEAELWCGSRKIGFFASPQQVAARP